MAAFTIRLEDERGAILDEVFDTAHLLSALLPHPNDTAFRCLCFIDPYGDTTFNKLQMLDLRRELRSIRCKNEPREEAELFDKIDALAARCEGGVHTYIKFYGD